MSGSHRISPTAHYTGYVWCRHRLSPPDLATSTGRVLFDALRLPMKLLARANGGLTLERMLLQRHRIIDHVVEEAIGSGEVSQVVELAAGLSGRGLRLTQRYPSLVYIEADLPEMAANKRVRLARVRTSSSHHVVDVDALATSGPLHLRTATAPYVNARQGVAFITEGLLNYFPSDLVHRIWTHIGEVFEHSDGGIYVSDLHFDDASHQTAAVRTFVSLLGMFARGSVHLHFADPEQAKQALGRVGFSPDVRVLEPRELVGQVPLPPPTRNSNVRVLRARYASSPT